MHKIIFEKWWNNDNKVFSIINYKEPWREHGIKPHIRFGTNGAKKKNGDYCLDVTFVIGYILISYTNYDLQGERRRREK